MLISPLRAFKVISTSFLFSFSLGYYLLPTRAQVVSDQTLDSKVDRVGTDNLVIREGKKAGKNLFHSFSEFSVPSNSTVHFDNDENIENIFSRVTGGLISNIDGLIKANENASLFLLNPAGIVFGPNAQLSLGGSFIATTAEAIVFPNGIEFSAVNTHSEPMLTVNIPIGLQYGKSPGTITTQGIPVSDTTDLTSEIEDLILGIKPGNTLAFVGGKVSLELTRLNTAGGRTEIGSISGEEFVALQKNNDIWLLNYEGVNEFSQVEFNSSSVVSGDGGSIHIQGKDININNTQINNPTLNQINGGDINLIATDSIELDRSLISTTVGEVITDPNLPDTDSDINSPISGKGGNILLQGNRILLSDGSSISAETLDLGKGGDIEIKGRESVELSGQSEFSEFLISSSISTGTAGNNSGGKIDVETKNLLIQDGGQILAGSDSFGIGQAGKIEITATESIKLSGTGIVSSQNRETGEVTNIEVGSGLSASSGSANFPFDLQSGQGGNVIVDTPKLLIEDGAQISVSNFGKDNAGDIEIYADELRLENKGEITAATASGLGGEINLTANSIILENGGLISARADRNGEGGNINITTDTLVLFDQSRISAEANQGDGGNITITTQGLFASDQETQITASSQLGIDGEVDINTPDVDSEVDTTILERSPLAVENLIYTGCSLGKNELKNQFNYIGRGGLPLNPMEGIATEDLMVDLGKVELPEIQNQLNQSISPFKSKSHQEIREATSWIINQKGNIELVAPTSKVAFLSNCQFHSHR